MKIQVKFQNNLYWKVVWNSKLDLDYPVYTYELFSQNKLFNCQQLKKSSLSHESIFKKKQARRRARARRRRAASGGTGYLHLLHFSFPFHCLSLQYWYFCTKFLSLHYHCTPEDVKCPIGKVLKKHNLFGALFVSLNPARRVTTNARQPFCSVCVGLGL